MRSATIRALAAGIATLALASAAAIIPATAGAAAKAHSSSGTSWAGNGSNPYWSAAGNWSGGAAPSGEIDELEFPNNSAACPSAGCEFTIDDIPSLQVGLLALDAGQNYLIIPQSSADALALSSGISFAGAPPKTGAPLITNLEVPITLTTAQAWTLSGVPGTPSQLTIGSVSGHVPLTLNVSNNVTLEASTLNAGPLTISGGGSVMLSPPLPGSQAAVARPSPTIVGSRGVLLQHGASLIFHRPGVVSGALAVARGSDSTLEVGDGATPDATVTVQGNVTLRGFTDVDFSIDSGATRGKPQPGTNYSQLLAAGSVYLNSATLGLSQGFVQGSDACASLKGGQTYTIVSAWGRLDGRFAKVANGQVVPLWECGWPNTPSGYGAIVRYSAHTVTATVVGPAQITKLVSQSLTPTGTLDTIPSIIGHGGYTEQFNAPAAGALTVTWKATVNDRRVTVASTTNTINTVGPKRITIALTRAGQALLQRSFQLPLTATAEFTPNGGKQLTFSRHITLGWSPPPARSSPRAAAPGLGSRRSSASDPNLAR